MPIGILLYRHFRTIVRTAILQIKWEQRLYSTFKAPGRFSKGGSSRMQREIQMFQDFLISPPRYTTLPSVRTIRRNI